ncbi:MAG: hypothetical protein AB7H97_08255 [Pseudobdellovibrionaceae bacterium]
MKFRTSLSGSEFEIPDEWWAFADMKLFDRRGDFYYYGGYPESAQAMVVALDDVEPPVRTGGSPLFRKYKLLPVLFALTSPECHLPPVVVTHLTQRSAYRFKVTNGLHRYYASAAVGFSKLPVVFESTREV